MSNTKQCPVCDSLEFHDYKLSLLRCADCGLVVSPVIWETQANERMEDDWFGEDYRKSSFWLRLFEAWNNRRSIKRLQYMPHGQRLLEVGIGSGSYLKAAQDAGFAAMGCDLSTAICNRAEQTYGLSVYCGPLSALPTGPGFAVIVMNHVLEHVQDPVAFLREVYRLLAPGGVVHIAVPNLACWEAALSGWTSYEPYHLVYFDRDTLTRTVTKAGFVVDQLKTHDSFSGWFLAVLRTFLGVNRKAGAVISRPAKTIGGASRSQRGQLIEHAYRLSMVLAGGGLWPLRRLQAMLGVGDELICMARKASVEVVE